MRTEDPLGRKLRYLNQVLLAGFLVASTILAARLAGLVGESHRVLVAMSMDLKAVSTVAGNISRDVDELRGQLYEIQTKVDLAVPDEEVAQAWQDTRMIKESLTAESSSLSEKSEQEIEQLMTALRESPLQYQRKDKLHSTGVLAARIYPKYLSMRNMLTSTEDFIEKVGSHTMFGTDYVVIGANQEAMKLSDWFQTELDILRAEQSDSP